MPSGRARPGATTTVPPVGGIRARVGDAERARSLLREDGIAILSQTATTPEAALEATLAVIGRDIVAYRRPVEIATSVKPGSPTFFDATARKVNANATAPLPAHIDGYMLYGIKVPDTVTLLCVEKGSYGGESFLVDAYEIIAHIEADPKNDDLSRFLRDVPIEQSSPAGVPAQNPVVTTTAGRMTVRHHEHQRLI